MVSGKGNQKEEKKNKNFTSDFFFFLIHILLFQYLTENSEI